MQHKFQNLVLVTGLSLTMAVTGLMTGCASPDRSSGRHYEDWRVSRRVKSALGDAPVYKFDNVGVDTFQGVVQLHGWVDTEEQRAQAAQIAQSVPGVREVVNSISLKPQVDVQVSTPSTPTGRSTTGERQPGKTQPQTQPQTQQYQNAPPANRDAP